MLSKRRIYMAMKKSRIDLANILVQAIIYCLLLVGIFIPVKLVGAWISPDYLTVISGQTNIERADIAYNPNNGYFLEVYREQHDEHTIEGRILDEAGTPITTEFMINPDDENDFPRVAAAAYDNYWVAVWQQDWYTGNGIQACRINQDGSKEWCTWIQWDVINLDNFTPDIGVDLLSGKFLIVWTDEEVLTGLYFVKGVIVDGADGSISDDFIIMQGFYPSVTQRSQNFFVASQDDFDDEDTRIIGRYVTNTGGMPFAQISLSVDGKNRAPSVAGPLNSVGPYVTVWHKEFDGSDYDIEYAVTSSSVRQSQGHLTYTGDLDYNPSVSFTGLSNQYVVNFARVGYGQWDGDWNIYARSFNTNLSIGMDEMVANMAGCEGTPVGSVMGGIFGQVMMSWDRCYAGELYARLYSYNNPISAPNPPTDVSASDGTYTDRVRLTWAAASGATYYQVYANTSNTTSGAAQLTSNHSTSPYDDFSAEAGITYYYWVKACNTGGCSDTSSSNDGYRAITPPPPPTDVIATNGTFTDWVRISWLAPSDATYFQVYRNTTDTTNGAEQLIADHPFSPYDDFSAEPGVIYYYWVLACNAAGCSDYSLSNDGYRAITAPLPPTGVSATDGTYTDRVNISWTASPGAITYQVYRNTSDTTAGATQLSPNPSASALDDYSANPGTIYYYWVKACNPAGCSEYSLSNDGYRAISAPLPPINIDATDGTYPDKVQVSWSASSSATYYQVFRNTVFDTNGATVLTDNHPASPYDDTTAAVGQLYFYWVKACNPADCSDYSGGDFGWAETAPTVPTNVSATDGVYTDRVRVTWSASISANYYQVYRNTANTTIGATTLTTNQADSPYDDTSAEIGMTYYYWVKACSGDGCSDYSTSDIGFLRSEADGYRIYLPIIIQYHLSTPSCGLLFEDDFSTDKDWVDQSGGTVYRDVENDWLVWNARRTTPMHYYYPIYADSDAIQLDLRFMVTGNYGNGLMYFGLAEDLTVITPNVIGVDRPGVFFGPGSSGYVYFFSLYSDHTIYDQSNQISYGGYNDWRQATLTIDQTDWTLVIRSDSGALISDMSGEFPRQHDAYDYVMLLFNYGSGWEWMTGLLDDVRVNGCTTNLR
jgi:fibronectin type 3 domain-containing protein